MMNDKFSAHLRQHLLETADERPADGQLATVIDRVADTAQRHPVVARLTWLPGRVGPFPSTALRYGLVALALIAATVAVAILGGGSRSPFRSTVFEGTWTATDVPDGSTLTLVVGRGGSPAVHFEDDLAVGAVCALDDVKVFKADGTGEITDSRLVVEFPEGGGCGSMTVELAMAYDYVVGSDTLRDQDDVRWTRVASVVDGRATPQPATEPPATLAPTPEPTPDCIDLARGGEYTAPVGPLSVTATVPDTPVIPWQGARDGFHLSDGCWNLPPTTIHGSTATEPYASSCMPDIPQTASFAEAIARLDTPTGGDISDRVDLTIGGHAAARYDISNLSTCPEGFGLWHGSSFGQGETGSLYVINVDGVLLMAIELNGTGSRLAELEEARAIVESLQIDL